MRDMTAKTKFIAPGLISILIVTGFFLNDRGFFDKTIVETPPVDVHECDDGRGSDIYFSVKDFEQVNIGGIDDVYIGMGSVYCENHSYEIVVDGVAKNVEYDEFENHINTYNEECDNCLLVKRTGWPYFDEVFTFLTDELVCEGRTKSVDADCVTLEQIQ